MRSDPRLTSGLNVLWIRFFLNAVYATMYVRDHKRPVLYKHFGIDPTDFGFRVFRITTDITRQVFPIGLRTDAPSYRALLETMRQTSDAIDAAVAQGGMLGTIKRVGLSLKAAVTFARLYLHPVDKLEVTPNVRLAPVW
jgi:magnesium-protoporphyrin IX monomethyl ester (oxidative) cyclase